MQKSRLRTAYVFVQHLIEAIEEGAVLRVRPKAMTVTVIVGGLLPIMFGGGAGSEVMRRIAAPMVGGMITAPMLSMVVLGWRLSAAATSRHTEDVDGESERLLSSHQRARTRDWSSIYFASTRKSTKNPAVGALRINQRSDIATAHAIYFSDGICDETRKTCFDPLSSRNFPHSMGKEI
jgi:AcrB/AcrD/AcrF family